MGTATNQLTGRRPIIYAFPPSPSPAGTGKEVPRIHPVHSFIHFIDVEYEHKYE